VKYDWDRVSSCHPCPICDRPDWCCVSADGKTAMCMRTEAGSYMSGYGGCGTYYLHRLQGDAPRASAPVKPPRPGIERAGPRTLSSIYSELLRTLGLSAAHRDNLHKRGLRNREISRRGYASLPVRGRSQVARGLHATHGTTLFSVPGFIVKSREEGKSYLTIAGYAGMLIPVRDVEGRIVALMVRRDDGDDGGPRYSYMSSSKYGGPGPGSPTHVPLGIAPPAPIVRVTEGPLKADIAYALSGLPTIGVAGVSSWQPALPILQALQCKTARMAFDADARDIPHVAGALRGSYRALAAHDLNVELELW
jgi:hypothetical protein